MFLPSGKEKGSSTSINGKKKKKIVHCGILVSVKTSDSSFVSLEATHYFAHLSQSCTALLSG